MLERRENQDLLFGDHDDRLSVSFIRSLPSWLFRVARSSPNRAVSGLSPHKQTRAAGRTEKKPSSQRKTAQCFKLSEFYLRIAKTATPTQVRTALNSNEKSTLRLKSNSQLRHNCPNTMRKQASDGVNCFIASLLCRATAPLLTLEPFFFYRTPSIGEDRMAVGLPTKRPNWDRGLFFRSRWLLQS